MDGFPGLPGPKGNPGTGDTPGPRGRRGEPGKLKCFKSWIEMHDEYNKILQTDDSVSYMADYRIWCSRICRTYTVVYTVHLK